MGSDAEGFEHRVRQDGRVEVRHHGTLAATLRGAAAADFLRRLERDAPQQLMARVTGSYRHGNERTARDHPRNRGR